jgi:hypothetical protein
MFKRKFVLGMTALFCASSASSAATLYSQNFDVDDSANWTVNNNNLGTNAANVFFDYSTVGIDPAPNSTGNTTFGMKIGANLNSANAPASGIPGISVSPTGQSFTGDYTLSFDWWSNYIGPLGVGATGSTMLSNYGIMSSGTAANYPGSADGVFFSATGDGQSATDYRIYSSERPASYDIPPTSTNPLDTHATYVAGSRNSSAALYQTTFPAGATAPGDQPTDHPTQTGSTSAGAAGFRWHEVDITRIGETVTWRVNGTLLASLDTSTFSGGGSNILFGHSDTNSTTNSNAALLEALQFTLIDNVVVTDVVPEPAAMSLLAVAALAGLRRRRRRAV